MRNYFRYDYKAYLLCLVTAACFWLLNAMGSEYTTDLNYPVRFVPDSLSSQIDNVAETSVLFNASGSGWELLKRSLYFKASPAEIPLSFVKDKHSIPVSKILEYLEPTLGKLKVNQWITDSITIRDKVVLQKKVVLALNAEKLKLPSSYRISGRIYLEPDYVTVDGPSAEVLKVPDTLYLSIKKKINKGVDTLLDLRSILSKKVSVDYNEAHLLFDVAPFEKKEKNIEATLIGFPDSLSDHKPTFRLTYYVQDQYTEIEKKARYKIILDYNMRDESHQSVVPVLIESPDYIRDYTISPAIYSLKNDH